MFRLASAMKLLPLTKKGKVNAVAVLVQLCSKVGELLPALELGAVVEAHYDELRWPINAPLRRRKSAKHHQRRQCGDDRSSGQCSPPRPKLTAIRREYIRFVGSN